MDPGRREAHLRTEMYPARLPGILSKCGKNRGFMETVVGVLMPVREKQFSVAQQRWAQQRRLHSSGGRGKFLGLGPAVQAHGDHDR